MLARRRARASRVGRGKYYLGAVTQGGDALRVALGYYLSPRWGCFIDALHRSLFSAASGDILPGKNETFPTDLLRMVSEHDARSLRAGGVPFRTPIDLSLLPPTRRAKAPLRRDGGSSSATIFGMAPHPRSSRVTARELRGWGGENIIWGGNPGRRRWERLALGYYLTPRWGCFIDALRRSLFSSAVGDTLPGKNGTFPTDLFWMVREQDAWALRTGAFHQLSRLPSGNARATAGASIAGGEGKIFSWVCNPGRRLLRCACPGLSSFAPLGLRREE